MDESDDDRRVEALDSGHNVGSGYGRIVSEQKENNGGGVRGEVDTSAPFESVKEAVTRFGGIGFWKPHFQKPSIASQNGIEEVFDAAKLEEEAVQLANDLVVKERATLEVLKQLESTRTTVEELKVKLQKESVKVKEPRKQNDENALDQRLMCPSSAPGLILMELKQAKVNLTRTTSDLSDIRATVESYNKKIEKERLELEKTRQRLSLNSSKVSSFEENVDFPREIHRLTSETEQFKKVTEITRSEVLKAKNRMEQTKMKIKTVETQLIAARKLKEATKASEALARSEINSLLKSENLSEHEGVTLSFEEYSSLKMKSRAATVQFDEAMVQVGEAEMSKIEILKRVEEATEDVKNSKRVLEEALSKAEAANNDKLKAEAALRKWRSDHGQRRKSTLIQNPTKFKNSSCRSNNNSTSNSNGNINGNARLLDVNGARLGSNGPGPVLRPMMSIGQILSEKLLLTEESCGRRKVSLAQMLSKGSSGGDSSSNGGGDKRQSVKRKKLGFGRISLFVVKPMTKKKKRRSSSSSVGSRLSCVAD